jgi:transposase InsO family protein
MLFNCAAACKQPYHQHGKGAKGLFTSLAAKRGLSDLKEVHRMGQRARHCSMIIQPGKLNQNAFVERFNRNFRDEVLNANLFNSVEQAQEAADDWVHDYNEF